MRAEPTITTTPHGSFIFGRAFDFTHRDIICISFAIAVHSLLLLWKGGILTMPNSPQQGLGDTLVEVKFLNDVPNFEPAGGSSPAPKTFLERMRSIIHGEGAAAKNAELATGKSDRIDVQKPAWNKAETLQNKVFNDLKGFAGVAKKQDALNVAMGRSSEIVTKPSQGNFKAAAPNLKENAFKVAPKDAPFQILKPKNDDALTNVNAIPMAVGRTTSRAVKSLAGGQAVGPALQSKTFANAGDKAFSGGSFGSGGSDKLAGGGLSSGGGALAAGPAFGAPGMAGAGAASGYGSGRGSGSGNGVGNGHGSGSGGRSWGGSGGLGTGSNALDALPRNHVQDDLPSANSMASRNGAGFSITGALANRAVISKKLVPYERDARVALRFRVDWSGHVLDGILIELSSGSPSFDNKVLEALKEWQFSRLPANRTNEIQEGVITFVFKGV